ncbi:MAG TPA: glycoside hydrolase family 15 protein [Candidatus Thermoplasmatota archaeon]|nr:glycoside hydrolase family 15 protein [Candidatus Thermoplasmatota archaeon]
MDRPVRDHYRPIQDYGIIGDCESAALVSSDGSIDWWCPPRFDAPSVFASVLDRERGGFFRIHGGERAASFSAYVGPTNVLRTEFRTGNGAFEIIDFMPMGEKARAAGVRLFRLVRGLQGTCTFEVEFAPRFNYGAVAPRLCTLGNGTLLAEGNGQTLALASPAPLAVGPGFAVGKFDIKEGEELAFAVGYRSFVKTKAPLDGAADARAALQETLNYWEEWARPHAYTGEYRDMVLRSALVLKLLTYEPTGAVVAAPTSSLPEWIGGVRNWDYRYAWIRDAVFAVRALSEVGHKEEARRFVEWAVRSADPDPAKLRVLYSVGGKDCTPEKTLPHLRGYRDSSPVRVGNAAEQQFQLDVYGELLEGAYACGLLAGIDPEGPRWAYFRSLADYVANHWRRPDQGIWEVRCEPQHFVLSKAMAWAALDRAAEVATAHNLPGDVTRWREEAETIRAEVMEKGWDEDLKSFKQAYDRPTLDAANLLLPLIGFVDAAHPRMASTIDRIVEGLTVNGLVYRYLDADDGLPGGEATFAYCTFWLVEALALGGRVEEARHYFKGILARASPLGLFAEELHPVTGEHLGNYPQGFPHIGLIRAANRLAEAERREGEKRDTSVAAEA